MPSIGIRARKLASNINPKGYSGLKYDGPASTLANSALNYTWQNKWNVDGDFDAVRLVYHNHQPNQIRNLQALVAVTETAGSASANEIGQPIVGGATQIFKDSVSSPYGWRSVTWDNGQTIPDIPLGSATWPMIVRSDWIPIKSVPRADGGRGRLVMSRVYINGSVNAISFIGSSHIDALMRTPTQANRGIILQTSQYSGDAVGTVSNGPTAFFGSAIIIGIEFRRRGPALTVMGIGDSTYQNRLQVADKLSTFGFRACADVSSDEVPVNWVNQGVASVNSETYHNMGYRAAQYWQPSVVVYEGFSPNDTATTGDILQLNTMRRLNRIHDMLELCKQIGAVLIVSTGIPGNFSAAVDDQRLLTNQYIRKMADNGLILLADFDQALSDGGRPSRMRSEYNFGDNIHPNEVGIEVMAGVLREPLKTIADSFKG